jgi:hypothetical protein
MIFKRCNLFDTDHPPPYLERCNKLKLETLHFRHSIADLTFFHFLHHNPNILLPRNRPTLSKLRYRFRNNRLYDQLQVRTKIRKNSFLARTTTEFNKLPTELQNIACNKTFRKKLIQHLNK